MTDSLIQLCLIWGGVSGFFVILCGLADLMDRFQR